MQSADVGHEEEEGDSPAGYYMDSNGMLVMAVSEPNVLPSAATPAPRLFCNHPSIH